MFTPICKIKVAHVTRCEKSDRGSDKKGLPSGSLSLLGLVASLVDHFQELPERRAFGLSPELGGVFGGYWLEGWEGVSVEAGDSLLRGLPLNCHVGELD